MSEDKIRQPEDTTSASQNSRRPIAAPGGQGSRSARSPGQRASVIAAWIGLAAILIGLLWAVTVKAFSTAPVVFIIAGAALVIFWLVINRSAVVDALRGRQARMILNSTAFIVVMLGIVVLLNYMGARYHLRKDFTKAKEFSLSEQTHAVAKLLDKEVKLLAFVSPEYYDAAQVLDRLREYEMLSPKIKLTRYDPATEFDKIREYDIRVDGTIVITSGGKTETVVGASEEQLTSAILAVTTGEKTKVYFLTGHGERPLEGGGIDGLGTIKDNLENQQYEVETLSLLAMESPQVPEDCAVLFIAGPQQPLQEKETKAVQDYLQADGKLFVAVDPSPAPDLHEILSDHGITPLDGMVMDPQRGFWGQVQVPLVDRPAPHQITHNLGALALPETRAFELRPREAGYPGAPLPQVQALMESSAAAWLESKPTGQVSKDPDEQGGPLTMAALVDETAPPPPQIPGMAPPPPPEGGTRMIVVGTSTFMTDRMANIGMVAGINFTLKSIAWLTENEKLITIPPKPRMPNYVTFTDVQRKIATIVVFLVPALIMLAGGLVWWIRRRG